MKISIADQLLNNFFRKLANGGLSDAEDREASREWYRAEEERRIKELQKTSDEEAAPIFTKWFDDDRNDYYDNVSEYDKMKIGDTILREDVGDQLPVFTYNFKYDNHNFKIRIENDEESRDFYDDQDEEPIIYDAYIERLPD